MCKLSVLASLTLAGCTNQQRVWTKDGATEQDFKTDKYECEKDARQSGYYGSGLIGIYNMQQFASQCMEAHGWTSGTQTNSDEMPSSDIRDRENAEKVCEKEGFTAPSKEYSDCFFRVYQNIKNR